MCVSLGMAWLDVALCVAEQKHDLAVISLFYPISRIIKTLPTGNTRTFAHTKFVALFFDEFQNE